MMLDLERRTLVGLLFGAIALFALPSIGTSANDDFIIVQSTTSTQDSGLFDHLLPLFTKKQIAETKSLFASRADDSGTHKAEHEANHEKCGHHDRWTEIGNKIDWLLPR